MSKMEKRRLDQILITINKRFDTTYLMHANIDTVSDHILDVFNVRLQGYIWGEKLPVQTIRYPKNWVEALKERFLPEYLKKTYPVLYTVHKVEFNALYPDYKSIAYCGQPVFIQTNDEMVKNPGDTDPDVLMRLMEEAWGT